MIYTNFKDKKLSMLSFGTMRLPTNSDGSINTKMLEEMTDYAISHGVNYFDTAYPYHGGMSEIEVGKALSKYPRESYCLATKYPGHQISSSYNPEEVFEEQLKKCGVDYFDFYLLHNVYENSVNVYLDEKWGIIDYFKKQRELGRIKHLGFSTHARTDTLKAFLEKVGSDMEFCQIQLNWVDATLQDAKGKVKLLNEYNIPIWVMEPLRGGKLCSLSASDEEKLRATGPNESIIAWSFRYLQDIKGVKVILSGMSNFEQMKENIKIFEECRPLSDTEKKTLFEIAENMKKSVPCTSCRYCTESCPIGLDIPAFISTYNELLFEAKTNSAMWLEELPSEKLPSACLACGRCAKMCPQMIDIPSVMAELAKKLEAIPKWRDICKEREEAAKRLKGIK